MTVTSAGRARFLCRSRVSPRTPTAPSQQQKFRGRTTGELRGDEEQAGATGNTRAPERPFPPGLESTPACSWGVYCQGFCKGGCACFELPPGLIPKIRKAKAQLELNLAAGVKGNEKLFHKYI